MSESDFKEHFKGEGLNYLRDNDFAEMDNHRLKKAIITAKRLVGVIDEELKEVSLPTPKVEQGDFSSEVKEDKPYKPKKKSKKSKEIDS